MSSPLHRPLQLASVPQRPHEPRSVVAHDWIGDGAHAGEPSRGGSDGEAATVQVAQARGVNQVCGVACPSQHPTHEMIEGSSAQ